MTTDATSLETVDAKVTEDVVRDHALDSTMEPSVQDKTQFVAMHDMDTIAEDDGSDDELEEGEEEPEPTQVVMAKDVPVSDLDVAASYAEMEIQSMASQFAATVVDVTKPRPQEMKQGDASDGEDNSGNETETEEEEEETGVTMNSSGEVSANENEKENEEAASSDDEDEDEDEDDRAKLTAEIEAAMGMAEEASASTIPKTQNEVAAVPVRKPTVEITATTLLARCGTLLSMNETSLIATVTSDSGERPLDEGSVLCLADRTVLGCVDEVFGPVLMPMYLVRFESADKIPANAGVGQSVFCVTEAATYLVPDQLRGKGTDASNIYDEEADDAEYSDDEAESAAKHVRRKRNRVDSAPAQLQMVSEGRSRSSSGGFFVDYQPQPSGRQRTGSGAWHAQARNHGRGGHHHRHGYNNNGGGFFQPIQAQPQGGITRYTSPGFVPGTMANYTTGPPMPPPPAPYGNVYGAPYAPGPQYGYSPYGAAPFEMQARPPFAPPYYAPPLPPNGGGDRSSNGNFHEANPPTSQYERYAPPPPSQYPGSYDYGQ